MMVISYTSFLFLVWILLSGHFEPLMLGLGLVSVLLTVFLVKRMTLIDHESYPLHLSSKIPGFLVFIMREIVKANIDVIKRIMTFKRSSISPQLFEVPASLKTDLGRVIYANSITLTPGTVSVELTREKILVHALTKEAADDLSSGKMAKSIPDAAVGRKGD
ncbi:MAG: Na+/H+ antiporter subunit E [Candidatus Thiodiazotropha sp. (ex Ctena orbiculata)]|uniref:Na+/H+ antiporter subunit E n=1 Tax=Candidatus Thiodiazotropha taylori TaxID=2792791 RepID=A0A944QRF6_9GAMM|nr:Na+/H+ antiporter subunit E [Candidatus Thiodiazotropha taylori]MBT2987723.1 Na+/H+ antiporter subunit E [Candidatus Thiodiazotropha taylori]MBT2995035.1 Na+/H+ antiporter subunit E [Candidatus Thiodiazotropha taylori]MBT3000046.1 Na+/H+ antiporter subunit E [Candidatus Thiodiazotropha taylori]MBV2105945.1 Na+/H+ antiporter subunit E [Candidatus Thiodiazotropha taylori]